jgi:predicted membrane channel-forming protein YqfA (hemolysin III family)
MVLPQPLGNVLLTRVSTASLAGINLAWVTAPRWLAAVHYLIFVWIAVRLYPNVSAA